MLRTPIPVSAAVIEMDGRILAYRRPAAKARPLMYEFPGGKREEGETDEAALIRECREELGVELNIKGLYTVLTHEYPEITVRLSFFLSEIAEGEPRGLENGSFRWVTRTEAQELEFCPPDRSVVEMLNSSPGKAEIENALLSMRDEGYAAFTANLTPNLSASDIIGVRVPELRRYARSLFKTADTPAVERFLGCLPHRYLEENNLHAFIIEQLRDYDECISRLDDFLPHVNNWATCDMMKPKVLFTRPKETLAHIDRWLSSGSTYAVRFGLCILMRYLGKLFDDTILPRAASVRSDEYYVKMMQAWFFATALTKRYDEALAFISSRSLAPWVHNKAIQKARESRMIPDERKAELSAYKI